MLDWTFLEKELEKATFEPALNLHIARLGKTSIGEVTANLIIVKLEAGKQLIPHLHEHDGEICLPLTHGKIRLGKARKNNMGAYEMRGDKIVVDWNEEIVVEPGKSLEILPAEAHHFAAPADRDFYLCFVLPEAHLGPDRKYVTSPEN